MTVNYFLRSFWFLCWTAKGHVPINSHICFHGKRKSIPAGWSWWSLLLLQKAYIEPFHDSIFISHWRFISFEILLKKKTIISIIITMMIVQSDPEVWRIINLIVNFGQEIVFWKKLALFSKLMRQDVWTEMNRTNESVLQSYSLKMIIKTLISNSALNEYFKAYTILLFLPHVSGIMPAHTQCALCTILTVSMRGCMYFNVKSGHTPF